MQANHDYSDRRSYIEQNHPLTQAPHGCSTFENTRTDVLRIRITHSPHRIHQTAKEREPAFSPAPFRPYAANGLSLDSAGCDVANRARPFAQFLKAEICSPISFDNGTNSVSIKGECFC